MANVFKNKMFSEYKQSDSNNLKYQKNEQFKNFTENIKLKIKNFNEIFKKYFEGKLDIDIFDENRVCKNGEPDLDKKFFELAFKQGGFTFNNLNYYGPHRKENNKTVLVFKINNKYFKYHFENGKNNPKVFSSHEDYKS
ncbi:MAG: hypothetical protein PHP00_12330 [Thiotrichaceae bacterium]|nr:hypothetical protein [Thiotrichaceae bacterium]